MCRLLAYASRNDRAVTDLLGPEQFSGFCDLSRLHRDGWGMAWLASDGELHSARSVVSAFEDDAFDPLARAPLGQAGFVHLRWATGDLAIAEENTHPFFVEGWAFGHQGEIPHQHRVEELMAPEWLARRRGTTDSELCFLHVLECIERTGDVIAGIRAASAGILAACGSASLNSVLLSSSSLIVIYGRGGLPSPRDDLLAAVLRPEDVPLDHLEAYFRLRYRRTAGALTIGSSGVPGDGWLDIPEDSIVHVDLSDLAMTVHPLDVEPAMGSPLAVADD